MTSPSDPKELDDSLLSGADDLAAEVADLMERCDPVPDAVVRSAKAAFAVRSVQAPSEQCDGEPDEIQDASGSSAESDPADSTR